MPKQAIFDKKNVLVVGGAGFIGSHLCDELIKTSKVICIDNFSSGLERNIDHLLSDPNFVFIKHDISEIIDLETNSLLEKFKIKFQGIQEIYYLACPMSPKNFADNRVAILTANSYGVKNALDIAVKYKSKFMFFSSSVIYGPRDNFVTGQKINEKTLGCIDTLSARSSYDEGKRFAEALVSNYKNIFDLDAKIVRLFRTYGPRMMLNDDQMIPDFISNAMDDKDIEIFGDENFSSSFCYVSDAIDAVLKLMETTLTQPINIGSDIDVNLTDLAKLIIQKIGSNSKIKYTSSKLFMTPLALPDITKARNELGWMPIITLDNGLEKTIFDLRANKRLRNFGNIV